MSPPDDAARRKLARPGTPRATVAVLAFAGMSASLMQTLVIPIQPELPALLSTSPENAAWVVTATLVTAAVCTPIAGRLGDMHGKRRILIALLIVQALGSVLAGLTSAVVPMIVARALQGMSAGVIPLGISILRDVLPPERLASAVALISATLGVGGALGLPLSALIAEHLDWHALFWMGALMALVSIPLAVRFVPVSVLRTPGRFDIVGAIGLSAGLVSILIALSRGGSWGWLDVRTWGLLLGGAVVLIIWGVVELRIRDPLVDLRLSARPAPLTTNLASCALAFALFCANIAFPQVLQLPTDTHIGLGLSLTTASIVISLAGVAMMTVAPIAGSLERRFGPKLMLVAGAATVGLSYASALVFHQEMWHILLANIGLGVGIGLGYAAMPSLIMRAVPSTHTGAANGLNALMRTLGSTVSAAVCGAIVAQAAIGSGGTPVLSEPGFMSILMIGLVAALVAFALAVVIPRARDAGAALPA